MSSSPSTTRSWLPARQRPQRSRASSDAGVGLGAVSDQVAEAPDLVHADLRVDVGEHRLEGGQVAMHVGKPGDARRVPSTVSAG